jgi:hypothetical protein
MRVRVTFRVNKQTGSVEEFLVEDMDGTTSGEEHEAEHDRIARSVGAVIDRRAAPEQVVGEPVGQAEPLLLAAEAVAERAMRKEEMTETDG